MLEFFGLDAIIENIAQLVVTVVKALAMVVKEIGKVLGIIEDDMELEDLGDKALQAEDAGIVRENFETYGEYVENIKHFDLDPDKSARISEAEKLRKGIEVTSTLILDKDPENIFVSFVECVGGNPEYFTEDKIAPLYEIVKDDPTLLQKIDGYLSGRDKNIENNDVALDTLITIEKAINPEISTMDAIRNIRNAEH